MVAIRRGSTPTVLLRLDRELPQGCRLRACMASGAGVVTWEGDRLAASSEGGRTVARVTLAQGETLALVAGEVALFQLKALVGEETVAVSTMQGAVVEEGIDDGVI